MFIMIDALESVDPLIKGDERLVIAMRHVGGSITMTTTTDLVAFAVSTISSFPAIHLFCIYASLSIFFAYAMLNTLFLAILTWDLRRIERGQRDVCPCAGSVDKEKLGNPWQKKEVDFSKKVYRILLNYNLCVKKKIETREREKIINLINYGTYIVLSSVKFRIKRKSMVIYS